MIAGHIAGESHVSRRYVQGPDTTFGCLTGQLESAHDPGRRVSGNGNRRIHLTLDAIAHSIAVERFVPIGE